MEIQYKEIVITKDEIPIIKKVDIDGLLYNLEFNYNEQSDFFTLILRDEDYSPILSTKLCYMTDALNTNAVGVPDKKLIPMNLNDATREQPENITVNWNNFGDTVKLYLI